MTTLSLTSPDISPDGWIPLKNSGYGANVSPQLVLSGIAQDAQSIAIILEDASHPIFPGYAHWLIWDLPVCAEIPAAIPPGAHAGPSDAVQGIAYGRNRYKGPRPPFGRTHAYIFTAYVLDAPCNLPATTRKAGLRAAMKGHILQRATLAAKFQRRQALQAAENTKQER